MALVCPPKVRRTLTMVETTYRLLNKTTGEIQEGNGTVLLQRASVMMARGHRIELVEIDSVIPILISKDLAE